MDINCKDVNKSFDQDKAKLGKFIFENSLLSFNANTNCQSCHLDTASSADGLPNAIGVGGKGEGNTRLKSNGMIVPRTHYPCGVEVVMILMLFFGMVKLQKMDQKL